MLTLPSSVRVYMASEATDMRRSFDRLASTVEGAFVTVHPPTFLLAKGVDRRIRS